MVLQEKAIFSFGLGVIEKTVIDQKLGQNEILQAFHKLIFKSNWSSEDTSFKRKIEFIGQRTKLESKVET